MQPQSAIDVVRVEATRFAALLENGDHVRPVRACPGWDVADLTRHLGGVHRWATGAIQTPPDGRVGDEPTGPADPRQLHDWFLAGARRLVSVLGATDLDRPCWTLGPPHTVGFWARRQAHETALHRWDLETALGREAGYPRPLAVDGIREVAEVLMPRQIRLRRMPAWPGSVTLQPDGSEPVLLSGQLPPDKGLSGVTGGADEVSSTDPVATIGDDRDATISRESVATISGDPAAVLLLLWRRVGLDDPRLRVSGEVSLVDHVLRLALTP